MNLKKRAYSTIWKTGKKLLGDKIQSKPFSLLMPLAYKIASDINTEYVQVFENKIFLGDKGPLSMELATNGIWEKIETEFMLKTIKKGDIVIDIGANIGYFTLLFAKCVGQNGKVFAFEPEPKNFELLKKNISVNKYENVVCENSAVSNKNEKIKLYLSEKSVGQHRIYSSGEVSDNSVLVDSITVDDYFKNINKEKITFIKIDAEGTEFFILKGMEKLLDKIDFLKIILEFDPNQIRDSGCDPIDLLNFLKNKGFNFSFSNKKRNEFESVDINYLIKQFVEKNFPTNLLCTRVE